MRRTIAPVLAGLATRLTDTQDRETYAALVSYVNELPPGDEFRQLMEMLGLVSLIGQRLPDALAEFLAELRAQAKAACDYHAQLDARLAAMPSEIAAGVEPQAIAKTMSEAFRQQIAVAGLQESAAVVAQFKALSIEIAQTQRSLTKTIGAELATLQAASNNLRQHNAALVTHFRTESWIRPLLLGFVLLLVGGLCGICFEKHEIAGLLSDLSAQIQNVQKSTGPVSAPVANVVHRR